MNATMTTATRRTNRTTPRWDVVLVDTIGFGRVVGAGHGRRQDAQGAAEQLALRPGQVATVVANVDVQVGTYALLGGRWVPNPTAVDIVAATTRIDPGYARQLWPSLASGATAGGKFWACGYVNANEQAITYVWADQPPTWAWDLATDGDTATPVAVAALLPEQPRQLAAAA